MNNSWVGLSRKKNHSTFIEQRSSLVPHEHTAYDDSGEGAGPGNQLSITEMYINMTDISNIVNNLLA